MKVKHIITTCGILLGGLAMAQTANAEVTYKTSTDVQFTLNSTLTVGVGGNFVINDLAPGTAKVSDPINVTVTTNSSSGYTLSARVGNSTYTTNSLVMTNGTTLDTGNVFSMTSGGVSTLTAGTWGYLVNSGTSYKALSTSNDTVINKTTNKTGTAASGYDGGNITAMKIGASANSSQRSGSYKNVINFTAVANVATHTVTVAAGTNVASVTPATATSYNEGASVTITATCTSGHTFSMWGNSTDYGTIANPSSASTTFTVGAQGTTLTAYCN